MRMATFNILHGCSVRDGEVDVGRLRECVARLDADVLGLQEVDVGQPRSATADLTVLSSGMATTLTPAGSSLARTAAAIVCDEIPETPIRTATAPAPPAKESPSTADMSSGAATQPMRTERSRNRRRSSFSAMTRINPAAPSP